MIKRLQKRISKGIAIAGELFSAPSPLKLLRNAIEADDEERALEIYMNSVLPNGVPLVNDLNPSEPFPSKKSPNTTFQTPLHLACFYGLYRLVQLFLKHGGNPNISNGRDETSLHCICNNSDKELIRFEILQLLITWKGSEVDGTTEAYQRQMLPVFLIEISINHVDEDGNSALHYASFHGLIKCVELLIKLNGILSLVNKSQMTCCEMSDSNNNKDLASMLELAMLFQPFENIFEGDVTTATSNISRSSILYLDCTSMDLHDLLLYVNDLIDKTLNKLINSSAHCAIVELIEPNRKVCTLNKERVEILLNAYGWDNNRLIEEYMKNPIAVYEFAKISSILYLSENVDDISNQLICGICCDDMIPCSNVEKLNDDIKNNADISRYAICCPGNHQFCLNCWSMNTRTQIRDNGAYCLSCPGFKCNEMVLEGNRMVDILLFSDKENLKYKYYEQRIRHVVDCQPNTMKWCPVPDCGAILQITGSNYSKSDDQDLPKDITLPPKSLICHNNHTFCLSCGLEAHSPCQCNDWKAWLDKVKEEIKIVGDNTFSKGDDIANALWMAANTKKCPRCTSPIEKDEGCNHMSCRKCRHEFCWICMQDWSLHSNNTGGFFQCNRYVSELMSQSGLTEEQNRNGDNDNFISLVEDYGNAHVETERIKARASKMARFIPLYTRFKAHRDSVLMEKRMFKDTMIRIQKELEISYQSLNNDSKEKKWLQGNRVNHPFIEYPQSQINDVDNIIPSSKLSYHPSIQFLQEGFVELIKCREILSGCVAYSFSVFTSDEDSAETIMKLLSRNRIHKYRSVMKLSDHKVSFDRLVADLEMYTEMLSDVVARRRLRASHTQIEDISKLARAKRIELEDLVYMYYYADALEKTESGYGYGYDFNDPIPISTSKQRSRNRSSRRSQNNNTNNSTTSNELMNGISIGPDGMVFLNDDVTLSDELDLNSLVALIAQIESSHMPTSTRPEIESPPSNRVDRQVERRQIDEVVDTPPRRPSRISDRLSQFLRPLTRNDARTELRIDPIDTGINEMHRSYDHDIIDMNDIDVMHDNTHDNVSMSTNLSSTASSNSKANEAIITDSPVRNMDRIQRGNRISYRPRSPEETQRAERMNNTRITNQINEEENSRHNNRSSDEETELNRAILLSLQELPSNNIQESNNNNSWASVSQENVDVLISMGFTSEQATETLQNSNNNVDIAINKLLGLT